MEATEQPVAPTASPQRNLWIRRATQPRTWLYVTLGGLALTMSGLAFGAYRSWDDTLGVGLAAGGLAVAALSALIALTLAASEGAPSPSTILQRGVAVLVSWLAAAAIAAAAATYVVASGLPFGDSPTASKPNVTQSAPSSAPPTASGFPGADQRLTLRGNLTIDGKPLDAQFLGARVISNGLLAACQLAIPPVTGGRYELIVMSDTESRGCGTPGAQVVLWSSVGNGIIYTNEAFPWPASKEAPATFDATFSSADPAGAGGVATEFKGHVVRPDGTLAGGGTLVEAFVGDTLCGSATVRRDDPESWFTLAVAGPDVPGCKNGGTITFEANGAQVPETEVNDLSGGRAARELRLTIP